MVWRKDSVNRAAKKHGNDAQPVAPCCEHKHLQLADPLPRAAWRLTFFFLSLLFRKLWHFIRSVWGVPRANEKVKCKEIAQKMLSRPMNKVIKTNQFIYILVSHPWIAEMQTPNLILFCASTETMRPTFMGVRCRLLLVRYLVAWTGASPAAFMPCVLRRDQLWGSLLFAAGTSHLAFRPEGIVLDVRALRWLLPASPSWCALLLSAWNGCVSVCRWKYRRLKLAAHRVKHLSARTVFIKTKEPTPRLWMRKSHPRVVVIALQTKLLVQLLSLFSPSLTKRDWEEAASTAM